MTSNRSEMVKRTMIHVVFDGPPGHVSGKFVECETPDGRSINAGEWHERDDGLWELRIPVAAPNQPLSDSVVERVARAIEPNAWAVMDGQLERMKHKWRGQDVMWDMDRFKHKESMAKARDVLAAIPSAGGVEEAIYHAEQLSTYIAQPTITDKQLASARYHNNKLRAALALARNGGTHDKQ